MNHLLWVIMESDFHKDLCSKIMSSKHNKMNKKNYYKEKVNY
jgi:hypothetical protein